MTAKDIASLLMDAGMGATALYTVRQLKAAVDALVATVATLKAGHENHESRLDALEKK